MPLLGFGVYQNYDTKASVLEAFKAGYRYLSSWFCLQSDRYRESDISTLPKYIVTKPMLAPQYTNPVYPERNYLSVSHSMPMNQYIDTCSVATKVVSKNHGYEKTLSGVDESLKKFGFGKLDVLPVRSNA